MTKSFISDLEGMVAELETGLTAAEENIQGICSDSFVFSLIFHPYSGIFCEMLHT